MDHADEAMRQRRWLQPRVDSSIDRSPCDSA
jgi:hypothetical protein